MQRSLSDRERDRVQYVGLVVLALIFLLAMRNDIVRYVLR